MNKIKIIGICGSPHINGNTAKLIKKVLEGCKEYGAEIEFVSLGKKKILPCRACYECIKNGKCILEDDLSETRNKMLDADGIVIGSPTYNRGIPAQMKAFFDRLWLDIHQESFLGKYTVYVNTHYFTVGQSVKTLRELCLALGYSVVGGVVSSNLSEFNGRIETDIKIQKRAFKMGNRLVDAIRYKKKYFWEEIIRRYYIRPVLRRVDRLLIEKQKETKRIN